jgi:VanZ family protein
MKRPALRIFPCSRYIDKETTLAPNELFHFPRSQQVRGGGMSLWSKFNERTAYRWLVWSVYVLLLTTALVLPGATVNQLGGSMSPGGKFVLAKTGHVGAYALLTILSGWLHVPFRFRLLLLFFLMAHAAATEWIQLNFSHRGGTVDDVVLDHLGIAAGLIVAWKWWSQDNAR